ncbi:polysaccharide biosynthesis/export family protein [Thermithiobacillus plumbiphilus]|uniref:Polysaccharide biosynthesis/export family protein n=1 Tax=Thermithiobacillus plumbiphilus TaxID=1729899 RepID=A0ABU9D640_9PROT
MNTKLRFSSAALGLATLMILGGCASTPTTNDTVSTKSISMPSAVTAQQSKLLDETLRQSRLDEQQGISYRVGPGDILRIDVYQHPELSGGLYNIQQGSNTNGVRGTRVDNDGTIQMPLVGSIQVAGKTASEIRDLIQQRLSTYFKDPSVSVQLDTGTSMRYNLLGEFTQPGLKYSDRPLNLLDVLALGGSVNMQTADLRGAYVARNGQKLPINFNRLLRQGDLAQNIRLRPGDTIFVPDKASQQAFVFGAVSKPGAVPFTGGRMDLLQALSQAGLTSTDITRSRLEDVRIIRAEGDRAQFIQVNAGRIMKGEAAPFELASGDIVYVPLGKVGGWNEVIGQVLPSLQFVSSLLNPFVQIEFLKNNSN